MFGRCLHVRIKAAEKALGHGRLDDALAAVQQPDLRDHPRGQALIDALVEPLIARARLHRQAGRYQDALADLDRLAALGRISPDAQTLRQQIATELRQRTDRSAAEREAQARAAEKLRAGRLETARGEVARVDDTQQRQELAEELDRRMQRGSELLQRAAEALERNDVLAALRTWLDVRQRYGRTEATERFAGRLTGACRQSIHQWHAAGRLEGLLAAQAALAGLAAVDPSLADCERLIELCRRGTAQLAAADYPGLKETLLRLKAVRADVAWVNAALAALAKIADGHEVLLASPLGLYASEAGQPAPRSGERCLPAAAPAAPPALDVRADSPAGGVRLDHPLLVLVDGGGSSLLICRGQVRIGRAGTSAEIDVPIPAELESHHADITRRGEDYFLTAYGPAAVNGRAVQHTLLRDGDRLVLGHGAKLTFHQPSARSASAVLRLSHRCRLAQDVSNIVLFRDTCLIGAGASCHVPTRDDDGQVVLFERAGTLCARQTGGSGHLAAPVQPVGAGQTLEFGGLRVTVKPYGAADARTA